MEIQQSGQGLTDQVDRPGLIVAIAIALIVLSIYWMLFLLRQRKAPATDTVIDVFIDTAVLFSAGSVLWRIVHAGFASTMSQDEQLVFAAGCVALFAVLGKRMTRSILEACGKPDSTGSSQGTPAARSNAPIHSSAQQGQKGP